MIEFGEDEVYVDTATVPVHIQKIRKKIEKEPSNPEYIETLWGTGYRFKYSIYLIQGEMNKWEN